MITAKLRVHKTTKQKVVNVPKQTETEDWKEGDIIEVRKVNIK